MIEGTVAELNEESYNVSHVTYNLNAWALPK